MKKILAIICALAMMLCVIPTAYQINASAATISTSTLNGTFSGVEGTNNAYMPDVETLVDGDKTYKSNFSFVNGTVAGYTDSAIVLYDHLKGSYCYKENHRTIKSYNYNPYNLIWPGSAYTMTENRCYKVSIDYYAPTVETDVKLGLWLSNGSNLWGGSGYDDSFKYTISESTTGWVTAEFIIKTPEVFDVHVNNGTSTKRDKPFLWLKLATDENVTIYFDNMIIKEIPTVILVNELGGETELFGSVGDKIPLPTTGGEVYSEDGTGFTSLDYEWYTDAYYQKKVDADDMVFTDEVITYYYQKSAKLTEYDDNQQSFCGFENSTKITENAILDSVNGYVISNFREQYTYWEENNVSKDGTNGVYGADKPMQGSVTLNNGQGFSDKNFSIADQGCYSQKSLMFKQSESVSSVSDKLADISNGVLFKDNTTYNVSFFYKSEGESDKDLQFSVINAFNKDYTGYNNADDSNVVTIKADNVAKDWTQVNVTFTTDFSYHAPDYSYSEEAFCIPALCINADIDDTARTVYIDAVSISKVVSFNGVSVLKDDEAQSEGGQAMRFYFSYITNADGEINVNGQALSVTERGMLIMPKSERDILTDADGDVLRDSVNTSEYLVKENAGKYSIIKKSKTEDLNNCWEYADGVLTFSHYVANFGFTDARDISVRGYVVLSDGTTYYSAIADYSLDEVLKYNKIKDMSNTYSLTDSQVLENVVIQGNSKVVDNGITFDWTGATLKFNAVCIGEVTVDVHFAKASRYFTVIVDGKRLKDDCIPVALDSGKGIYRISFNVGNEAAEHEIQICRQAECNQGNSELISFTVNGYLSKANQADTLIEFIGDSITCGSGNIIRNGEYYGDGTKAYAFLTAQRLGFDYRIRSKGGSGFMLSSAGTTGYGLTWDVTYGVDSYVRSTETPYTFDRQADVVCIYLGTNDCHALGHSNLGKEDVKASMREGMKNLINTIKPYNPDAKYVWIVGGMTSAYKTRIEEVMEELGGEEAGYYVCNVPSGMTSGGNGHPTAEQHTIMGDAFTEFLLEKGLVK